jgi:hypothetical protein
VPVSRRIRVLVLVLTLWVAPARPAAAHPFGPPPTADIRADGRTITVDWSATPDDAVAIGESLGVMPPGSIAAYRQESAAQVAPSSQDEARLSASPLLHDYLRERIVVVQDGRPCEAQVPAIGDFVHAGATVALRCPDPVTAVTLRITMLHDLHDAYRTVAVGTGTSPQQSVFSVSAPEHEWRFGDAAASSGPWSAAAGAAAVAAAAAVTVLLIRRRRTAR